MFYFTEMHENAGILDRTESEIATQESDIFSCSTGIAGNRYSNYCIYCI